MTGDCFVCRQLSLNKPSKNLGDVAALKGLKWEYGSSSSVSRLLQSGWSLVWSIIRAGAIVVVLK